MIDLNIIAVFLEAARTGNLSEVALKLHVTPSAISQKIKVLENQVGKTLFIRKRSGVELNRDGREFLESCANFKMGLSQVANWIEAQAGKVGGEVNITTTHGLLSYELPNFIKQFYSKYSDVFLTIKSVSTSRDVEEDILAGQTDLGVIVGACKKPSLKSKRLLANNQILMVCSSGYFLAKKKDRISKADLAEARIIIHGNTKNRSFKDVCKEIGIEFYTNKHKLCLPDMESCKKHVLEGLGISFISKMYIGDELKNRKIISLPGFKMNRPIYLVSRNEKYESPAITAFKNELVKYCDVLDKNT